MKSPAFRADLRREKVFNYDKGVPFLNPSHNRGLEVLGEVLEDVMGKGLIPADFETWRVRRRAIVSAASKAFISSKW